MKQQPQSASFGGKNSKFLQIGNHLRPYGAFFTKPTRVVFQTIIREMLTMKIPNSTDLALGLKKSISSISYFFNEAVWDHREIEKARKVVMRNAEHTRPSSADIICLDSTTISKTGTTFPDISRVFDTADKKVKDGYYFYVASIVNLKRSHSYIADWILIAPKAYHFKSMWMGWFRLLKRIFALTKAKLIVLDAGFRNQYLLQFIRRNGRFFLIRVTGDMMLLKNKIPIKLRTIKKRKGYGVKCGNTKLVIRIARGVMKAWSREITEELTIIMVERSGFRHPLILATNQAGVTLKDAVFLYQTYCKRWSIEVLFKELKLGSDLKNSKFGPWLQS